MPAEPLRPAPLAASGPASGPASRAASRAGRWAFALAVAVLAVSGMAQMPIFKRYGIADVPGLAWTADYHVTHLMHYAAAAVLLFLLFRAALLRLAGRRGLSAGRWLMAAIWAGIVLTGLARVVKNLPAWDLGPLPTLVADWSHLGLTMLLGIAALALRRAGRKKS
jgi:hypothetical protein